MEEQDFDSLGGELLAQFDTNLVNLKAALQIEIRIVNIYIYTQYILKQIYNIQHTHIYKNYICYICNIFKKTNIYTQLKYSSLLHIQEEE